MSVYTALIECGQRESAFKIALRTATSEELLRAMEALGGEPENRGKVGRLRAALRRRKVRGEESPPFSP